MSVLLFCVAIVVGLADVCPTGTVSSVGRSYVTALERAGAVPVVLPRLEDRALIGVAVDKVDLVLLCGGEDVDPARYGQTKSPRCECVNGVRDAYEWALLDECVCRRKPVFGICRGLQLINCHFGGTLIQDVNTEVPGVLKHRYAPPERPGYIDHDVEVVKGSRLADVLGAGTVSVKAWHHQSVGRLAPGFRVSARAADGVIEAIESDSYPAAGTQFHPEMNVAADPDGKFVGLFQSLPLLCGKAGGPDGRLVFHFDFKAGEMRREEVRRLLRDVKAWGYTSVLWELEDRVRFDALGSAVRPTAYSKDEFRAILKEAESLGLEPIPLLQVFGHSEFLMHHEAFRWMREKEDDPSCYCVSNPKVQAFLQALFDEYLDLFGPSVRTFHLAGDEAHSFGTCPVCAKRPRGELYVEHLERFAAKLRARGIRPGIWSDMLLSELDDQAAALLGTDYVIWQWDYDFGTGKAKPWTARLDRILGKGFDIVVCGAAQSVGDDPFLVRYGYHRQNLAASAKFARDRRLAGFCVTSWPIRGAGKWAQRPLFDFAARRYLKGEVRPQAEDWAECVKASFGGIPPELLDRLSDCSTGVRRIDGRNRRRHYDPTHKPAAPADSPAFAEEVANRLADTKLAYEELRRCAPSLTSLGGRLLPATECKLGFLAFAVDYFAGKVPTVDLKPFARFYALEETPTSAEISATIPFSRMGY